MRIVTAAFHSPDEFLRHYATHYPEGAIFYRTRMGFRLGEQVLVELSFPGLPNRALLRGQIAAFDERGAGAWVRFAPEDDSTRDFVLSIARGETIVRKTVRRHHLRFPVNLPVAWHVSGSQDQFVSSTCDLGAGGLFVRTLVAPDVGTKVSLKIGPTPAGDLEVEGEVSWVRSGEDAGMGVRFATPQDESTRRLRSLLRQLSERGKLVFSSEPALRAEA